MVIKHPPPWIPLIALFSSLAGLVARGETPVLLPTPFPEARYQQMSARSPFAVATTSSAPTAAPTPGFAAQLYVEGVAHIGKSDFVAIKSRDPDQTNVIFLEVGKSTDDGMKVERVTWSSEMGKSTVGVSKGGETATLAFDEAQLAKNATPAMPPGQPMGIRLPMVGPGRPMNFPMQPGQQQFNRFYPQQPGQPVGPQSVINNQRRWVRGLIPSGQ